MKNETPIILLVIFSALLFVVHQYLQRQLQINIAFLDNYLDPAVLMPMLLYAVLWERRFLLRDKTIVLSYTEILGYFLLIVIIGEVLFPFFSEKFTADYWDVLAYAVGTLAYVVASQATVNKKYNN